MHAAILSPTVVRLVLAVEPVNGSAHTLTMVAGTAIGLTPGNYGDATPVAFTGVSVVPTVVSVLASSPTTVQVIFSKPVRQVSASNADDALHAANYTFTGLTVSTIRGVSPTEVEVTTSAQSAVPYAWAVSLAADLAGNPVTPATGSVDGYVAPVVPYGVFIFLTPHTVQVTLSVSVKVNAILLQPDAWAFIPRIASTKRIYVESVSPVSTPLTTVIILNLRDEASVSGRYDLRITGLTDYADNLVEVTI